VECDSLPVDARSHPSFYWHTVMLILGKGSNNTVMFTFEDQPLEVNANRPVNAYVGIEQFFTCDIIPYILAYKSQNLGQNHAPKVGGRLIRGS